MARARRVDANHKEIVKAFRALGWSVLDLSRVGNGCPDILVGRLGTNILIEIKDGKKPPSKRNLTEEEEDFFTNWRGNVLIVESLADVVRIAK